MLRTIRKMFEGGRTAGTASETKKNLKERGLRMELCEDRVLLTASPLQADLPSINDTAYTALDFNAESTVLEAVVVNMDSVNTAAAEQGTPVAEPMAAVITVTNLNDSGDGSFRQALATADDGDTIVFADTLANQTITVISALEITKAVTVNGNGVTLDANGGGFTILKILKLDADNKTVEVDVTLNNLKLINSNVVLTDKVGAYGSGIHASSCNLTLNDCTISGTSYSRDDQFEGGAIYIWGNLTVNRCTITNNTNVYGSGGGICYAGDLDQTLTITDSVITGNTCNLAGGGVYVNGQATLNILGQCDISNNSSTNVAAARNICVGQFGNDVTISLESNIDYIYYIPDNEKKMELVLPENTENISALIVCTEEEISSRWRDSGYTVYLTDGVRSWTVAGFVADQYYGQGSFVANPITFKSEGENNVFAVETSTNGEFLPTNDLLAVDPGATAKPIDWTNIKVDGTPVSEMSPEEQTAAKKQFYKDLNTYWQTEDTESIENKQSVLQALSGEDVAFELPSSIGETSYSGSKVWVIGSITGAATKTVENIGFTQIADEWYPSDSISVTDYTPTEADVNAAIAAAGNGDTIVFADDMTGQTISLSEQIVIEKSLTIDGNGVTFDRGLKDSAPVVDGRVFALYAKSYYSDYSGVSEAYDVTLKNMTITGGNVDDKAGSTNEENVLHNGGGGILSFNNLTLDNVIVTGNQCHMYVSSNIMGGGISTAYNTTLTIRDSEISGNASVVDYSRLDPVFATGKVYSGYGGGIACSGSFDIDNTKIIGNASARKGGGVYANFGNTPNHSVVANLTNSIVSGNISDFDYASELDTPFTRTYTSGDNGDGGGIYYDHSWAAKQDINLEKTIIVGNKTKDVSDDLFLDVESPNGFSVESSVLGTVNSNTAVANGDANYNITDVPADSILGQIPEVTPETVGVNYEAEKWDVTPVDLDTTIFFGLPTDEYTDLQTAINAAVDGDTIIIRGINKIDLATTLVIDKSLTIIGNGVTLDRGLYEMEDRESIVDRGSTSGISGAFSVTVAENATVTLSNLTITGGDSNGNGGAIIKGGAGELILNDVTLTENHASIAGGALSVSAGSVVMNGGKITNNDVSSSWRNTGIGYPGGGAAFVTTGSITLHNVEISGNTALYRAGGVLIYSDGILNVDNCNIHGNEATGGHETNPNKVFATTIDKETWSYGYGGAIFGMADAVVNIVNSTITDNTACNSAGGVGGRGELNIINTVISENTTQHGNGGGVEFYCGTITIENSSIVNNNAPGTDKLAGGVIIYDKTSPVTATINNTLIAGNTVGAGDNAIPGDLAYGNFEDGNTLVLGGSGNIIGVSSDDVGRRNPTNTSTAVLTNTISDSIIGTEESPVEVFYLDENGDYQLKDIYKDSEGNPIVGVGSTGEAILPEETLAASTVVTDGGDDGDATPKITLREAIYNAIALERTSVTVDSVTDIVLTDDLTIPAGITVDLGTATITVPAGKTLTVNGDLNVDMPTQLIIAGSVVITGDTGALNVGGSEYIGFGNDAVVQLSTDASMAVKTSATDGFDSTLTGVATIQGGNGAVFGGDAGTFYLGSNDSLTVGSTLNVNVPVVCTGTITATADSITLGDNAFLTYPEEIALTTFASDDVTPVANADGSFTYYPTFQAAIEIADGGTLLLQDDVELTSSIILNNSITIDGGTEGKSITYADDATGFPLIQVGKNDLAIGFQNLTLTNGKSTDVGGGIRNFTDSTLELENVTMTGCSSEMRGGAVYSQGDVTVTGNCSFSGNTSKGGAAIYVDNGAALTIEGGEEEGDTGVVFTGNNGSAVYVTGPTDVKGATFQENNGISFHIENSNSKNTFENTEFIANKDTAMQIDGGTVSFNGGVLFDGNVGSKGGAIYQAGGKIISDYDGTGFAAEFTSNEGFRGGAIFANGSVDLTNMSFANNQATYGGAIFVEFNGNVTATESASISQNYATTYGGAIYNDGSVDVTNMTISNNWAGTNYGALYNGGTAEGTDSLTQPNFVVNAAHARGIVYNTKVDNNRLMILPAAAEADDSVYEMYTYSELTIPYGQAGYISDTDIAKTTAANAALALKYLDGITGADSATKDTTIANFSEVFISAQYEQYVSPKNYEVEGNSEYNWLRVDSGWEFATKSSDTDKDSIVKAKYSEDTVVVAACDFDDSGKVDMVDFVDFAQSFNSTDSSKDFDGNGKVDMGDFVHFAQQFNKQVLDLAQEEALAMKAAAAAELPEAPTAQPVAVVEAAPVAEAAAAALPEAAPVVVDAPKATVREVVNFWDSYDALDDVVDAEIVTPTSEDASLFGDDEVELFETEALEELAIEL